MVKALYFELEKQWDCDDAVHFALIKLAEALEKMPNLVDLRIIYNSVKELEGRHRISQVIRGGYFKLHTLYLKHSHDLGGIIANQPQLRLLGICFFFDTFDTDLWMKIEQLYQGPSRHRTMPTVLLWDCLADGDLIYMLPSFHRPGEALQACQEIAASLNKWRKSFHRSELSLSLIGISEENISLFGEVIRAVVACKDYYTGGMNIVLHDGYIQKPWRFPEFVKALALLKDLEELRFILPDAGDDVLHLLSTDLQSWVDLRCGTWPTIQQIVIENQTEEENILLGNESEWAEEEEVEETESEGEDDGIAYDDAYTPSPDEWEAFV
ncbi:hypothetical protein AX14_003756 [Amanita brunnescens Koide BX004]|nr:hypothetical protein AX14_003756 [Amanita brunnescens Koide BX004]